MPGKSDTPLDLPGIWFYTSGITLEYKGILLDRKRISLDN
jgi:hypothetical protein